MSEDVSRPRPVVDTALPADVREDAYRRAVTAPHHPMERTERPPRSAHLRDAWAQLLWVGVTLVIASALAGGYLGMIIATISLVVYVCALALRTDAARPVRVVGAGLGVMALAATPLWLWAAAVPGPPVFAPWILFTLLAGTVTADVLTSGRGRPTPADRRENVLLPGDISVTDHRLLVDVQRTIDRVVDARAEAAGVDTLDTARGLSVLREQEWRIASLLSRQRELRRAYLVRHQRATSDRVRAVLRAQQEHLAATEQHIRARVEQIVAYGSLVEAAVRAQREWEQCEEAVAALGAYAELRAEASLLAERSSEVAELTDIAEAARRVRDASAARVHTAATDLVHLAD
ncbi:hypothetical protein [Nocardiopsis sp. MG754419]|uniref:hypothetical protein n=1 Tax=Nocardiopsis sp. MG754419 TaxID=2259865 RepID=UPI001BAE4674|nr:hypothetical protein [Nocardiopsis sp. MG754419]MBR8742983.1 hypothetical protein [Nocardiopsis sp. MG754419]